MRTSLLIALLLAGCGAAAVPRETYEARLRELEATEPDARNIEKGDNSDVRVFFAQVQSFEHETTSGETSAYAPRLRKLETRYWIAAARLMGSSGLRELLAEAPAVDPERWAALEARLEELAKVEWENRPAIGTCFAARAAFGDDGRVNASRTLIARPTAVLHVRCWVSHEVEIEELEARIDGQAVPLESAKTGRNSSGTVYVDFMLDLSRAAMNPQAPVNIPLPRQIGLAQRWSRTVKLERNYDRRYVARPAHTYLRLANGTLFHIPGAVVARQ